MDGGRILKSVKTSYAEYLGNERMADIVREMMKQQHKAMFIALRDGKFDALVDGGADASQATQGAARRRPTPVLARRAGAAAGRAAARHAASPPTAASRTPPAMPGPPAGRHRSRRRARDDAAAARRS